MNKTFGQLFGFYFHKTGKWLFATLLSISLLPVLLKSMAMLIHQNTISVGLLILFDLIVAIGVWLLFTWSIRAMEDPPRNKFPGGLWKSFYRGGLWLIAAAMLVDITFKLYAANGGLLITKGQSTAYLIGLILVTLLLCLVLVSVAFWVLNIMADPERAVSFPKALGALLKKPMLCIGGIVSVGIIIFILPMVYDSIIVNMPNLSLSFLQLTVGGVLLVWLQWMFLQPLLMVLYRNAKLLAAPVGNASRPVFDLTALIKAAVAVAIIIAAGIYTMVNGYPTSPVTLIKQDIQHYMTYVNLSSAGGDHAAAAYYSRIAEARILAWKGSVLDTPTALDQAVKLAPSDEQVLLLNALKNTNSLAALEQGFLNSAHSRAWSLALLDAYKKAATLTDVQKVRKAEILNFCILQGYYVRGAVLPEDLLKKKDDLAKALGTFDTVLISNKTHALIARVGEEGGLTKQLMLDALTLSETYTDQIDLQFLAMSYGSSFREDNANYYKRVSDAALRYDALYMKQRKKNAKEADLLAEKQNVAKALMTAGNVQGCADLLAGFTTDDPALSVMKASVLFSLKEYDKSLAAAADVLKKAPENAEALYLAAICALQTKNVTDSLKYAISLADLVKKAEDPVETETMLYPYLLRLTISDVQAGYITEAYSKLTKEQTDLMQSNDFFNNYVSAVHSWALGSEESRKAALVNIETLLAANGKLSRVLYLKGSIYFEQVKDAQALENLKASLALDDAQPTAWYAMACLYDRAKQYPEAYAACQKVLDYIPSTDHSTDVFGVSIHASLMMSRLEPLIKGGG